MDNVARAERARFSDVVEPYAGRIRRLVFGHVHRPFSALRGTNHQIAFDLDPDAPRLASHEPPGCAVSLISGDSIIVHTHDDLDAS